MKQFQIPCELIVRAMTAAEALEEARDWVSRQGEFRTGEDAHVTAVEVALSPSDGKIIELDWEDSDS